MLTRIADRLELSGYLRKLTDAELKFVLGITKSLSGFSGLSGLEVRLISELMEISKLKNTHSFGYEFMLLLIEFLETKKLSPEKNLQPCEIIYLQKVLKEHMLDMQLKRVAACKNHEICPKERLENILGLAKKILYFDTLNGALLDNSYDKNSYGNKIGRHEIFTLVKILADKIVIDRATMANKNYGILGFWQLISLDNGITEKIEVMVKAKHKVCIETVDTFDISINLAKDPIISFPWDFTRMAKLITNDLAEGQAWEEKTDDHKIHLYLPLGVSIAVGGHHSISLGVLRNTGSLFITKDSGHLIFDMSKLLEFMRFDGVYYRECETDEVICKANSFEFGCIFEIGRRFIKEKGKRLSFNRTVKHS